MRNLRGSSAAAFLVVGLLSACGGGGHHGGGGGGGGGANTPPTALITTPTGPMGGDVAIPYTLADPEGDVVSVAVQFSTDGGTNFAAATPSPSSEATSGLAAAAAGTGHAFTWNSLLDGVGTSGPATAVKIRVTPSDAATGVAATTAAFTVDNSANTAPSAGVTSPTTSQTGLVALAWTLTDAQSNPCTVSLEFSTNGGGSFSPATIGPGPDGASGLASSPGGTAHTLVWNSFADGVGTGGPVTLVRLRVTPSDGSSGAPSSTANFTVDNSTLAVGGLVPGYPVTSDPTTSTDRGIGVATDGRYFYVLGYQGDTSGNDAWRVEKRDGRTGALVAGFGTGGAQVIDPSGGSDEPTDIGVFGSYLFVVGWVDTSPFGNKKRDVRLERRSLADGSLVAGFGSGGVVTIDVDDGDGASPHLASDGTNLYVAFADHVPGGAAGDYRLRVEKRALSNGALDAGFGSGGVLLRNLDSLADGALAVATDGVDLYLAEAQELVVNSATSNGSIRIEKRSLSTGALVAGFGSGGAVTEELSSTDDLPSAIALDGTSMYLLVQDGTPGGGTWRWRFEKRALSDGSLTTAVNGAATSDAGDQVASVALVGGSLYATSFAGNDPDFRWRIEKRNASDLALVPAFATAGVATSDPTTFDDRSHRLVEAGGVLFVVGEDANGTGGRIRVEARWR